MLIPYHCITAASLHCIITPTLVTVIFRVMIGAVSTKQNPPLLHFFNNCFNDEFSGRKPAAHTSRHVHVAV